MIEKNKEIDEYILKQPVDYQAILQELRTLILDCLVEGQECIAWNMPSYKRQKYIVHFKANKKHISVYFGQEVTLYFKKQQIPLDFTGMGIKLSYNETLPTQLLKNMILLAVEKEK